MTEDQWPTPTAHANDRLWRWLIGGCFSPVMIGMLALGILRMFGHLSGMGMILGAGVLTGVAVFFVQWVATAWLGPVGVAVLVIGAWLASLAEVVVATRWLEADHPGAAVAVVVIAGLAFCVWLGITGRSAVAAFLLRPGDRPQPSA